MTKENVKEKKRIGNRHGNKIETEKRTFIYKLSVISRGRGRKE